MLQARVVGLFAQDLNLLLDVLQFKARLPQCMLPFLIASIERLVAVQMVGIGALFIGKQLNARLGGIEPSL